MTVFYKHKVKMAHLGYSRRTCCVVASREPIIRNHQGHAQVRTESTPLTAQKRVRDDVSRLVQGRLSCAWKKTRGYREYVIPGAYTSLPKPAVFHTGAADAYAPHMRTRSGNSCVIQVIDHPSKRREIVPLGKITAETVPLSWLVG